VKESAHRHGRAVEVHYRQAVEGDLPRVFQVFRAALNAYLVPAGQPEIPDEDPPEPAYRHLLRHDGERFWVAEAVVEELTGGVPGTLAGDGEQVVGWGCGLVRGDWWFLSSLFVLPEAQGLGVGAMLYDLAGTGAPAGAVRATVADSLQPLSNNLYARRGLLPREVLIGFEGAPPATAPAPRVGALVPEPLTPESLPALAEVDAAAAGVDRTPDHGFYLTAGGRQGFLFRRAGRPAGYVMVRPDGWVGPAAAVRAADMEPVTACGIAALGGPGLVEKIRAGVVARSDGAQRAFWGAGLRFSGTPGLLLAARPWGALDRYVPASYGLF
jgi:GNAT superfamily N-acetyltransferase